MNELAKSLNELWTEYEYQRARSAKNAKRGPIHEMRTVIRRMSAILDLIGVVHPTHGRAKKLKKLLHRELKAVRELRDLQVQEKRVEREQGVKALLARIEKRKKRAKAAAFGALTAKRIGKNRKSFFRLERELEALPEERAEVETAVGKIYHEMKSWVPQTDPARPETIHHLRVLFRKYLYICDALGGLDPRSEKTAREFQGLLGELQDRVVLKGMLKKGETQLKDRIEKESRQMLSGILQCCEKTIAAVRPTSRKGSPGASLKTPLPNPRRVPRSAAHSSKAAASSK